MVDFRMVASHSLVCCNRGTNYVQIHHDAAYRPVIKQPVSRHRKVIADHQWITAYVGDVHRVALPMRDVGSCFVQALDSNLCHLSQSSGQPADVITLAGFNLVRAHQQSKWWLHGEDIMLAMTWEYMSAKNNSSINRMLLLTMILTTVTIFSQPLAILNHFW